MPITLRNPKVPDARYDEAVYFLQLCIQRDPQAPIHSVRIGAQCAALRDAFPDDPALWQISSIIAGFIRNLECAKFFLAQAILRGLDEEDARAGLDGMISADPFWPDVPTYKAIAKSQDGLSEHYLEHAQRHFAAGELDIADIYCQRVSALGNPAMSQVNDIGVLIQEALAHQENGTLEAQYEDAIATPKSYWSSFAAKDVETQLEQYAAMPDRAQFAELTADAIRSCTAPSRTVLEIGCFAGYNLNAARACLSPEEQAQTRFVGLEPNANVVAKAQELFPEIEFLVGDHEALLTGKTDAPDRIDVCTISRVLMVILPDGVERLLRYLAPRTDTLIICDDIFNIDGDMPLIRTPSTAYLLHNFRQVLDGAGFTIEDMIMANPPDRECTGFIIAKGRGETH